MKKKSIALESYRKLADEYAKRVETKPHNAYYERPATLSLLPDVYGLRVLDAGCGPGIYSEWLVNHGAFVKAVDVTPEMVRHARNRLGNKVEVLEFDLSEPLTFSGPDEYDLMISPLVLNYIEDLRPVSIEFFRILKPGGTLVYSFEHPFSPFVTKTTANYFKTELVSYTWRGFGEPVDVQSYIRPLAEWINPFIEAGFVITKILEPKPTDEFLEADPEDYSKLSKEPGFMVIRAIKPA